MDKSLIIVGSGMAGLSAGCYALMNGFKTTIFEKHSIPGGLCTAWKRKGYTFDISMHLVTGSKSGPFNQMWNELGVMKNIKFHFHDHYAMIEGSGKKLLFSTDKEFVRKQMVDISPADKKLINEFTELIFHSDMLEAASLKPASLSTLKEKLKVIPYIIPLTGIFMKYGKKSLQDYAALFKDPFLRDAVRFLVDCPGWPMPDFPMITLAGYINTSVVKSGVPLGGSQQVAFKISDLFRDLGGELKFNKRVSDLIVKDNNVSGVRLENGSEHLADFVLWAADGRTLIYDILKEKYISPAVGEMYNNWTPVKSIVHVMFGVNRDFSAEPHRTVFALEKPEIIAGEERKWLCMLHHSFDKSMSPEGKSVVEVWYDTDYDYWEKLYTDKDKYKAEKKKIAEFTISQLERRYPGFASQIEVTDVPTPMTYKRYTDNWRGSPDGWYMTNSNIRKMEPVHNLPGLNALYMAGQWTAPYTGTVIAALSGRQAVEILCKREGKKFLSSTN